ncbi:hypothetical protein [Stenotrophomonas maltophilia group sp. RNC7]|uniref:hypothetical protein n=1 Tax=Stenotrophomonas maltophilia group sp. RNC7 TaxID=3071467 RepID=UPI0027E036B7|nr:hypothetical protein [Stenotrophomonas maltophilia group sp. RNC7]MDQ4682710.1 hypothetical protein [Stenotrophomonas maltophilia group sp. RNC7]
MRNTTTIQFIKDSFQRQADYWDGQRDHSDDSAYDDAVSVLNDLRDTTDVIDEAILQDFAAVWDSEHDPRTVWAELLMSIGDSFVPGEAERVLQEFLEVVSGGGA